ncbi:MAG: methyltransferase domain-containing protein [Actinobacteria bacterium]|nr:methyltransferase domain-containing protein [Actinomycetota bacterium]MBU2687425.1 methyltransferase domain-containing protein [Actinomycetota bacterium]
MQEIDETAGGIELGPDVCRCPRCGSADLVSSDKGATSCPACGTPVAAVDGVLECFPGSDTQRRYWDSHFQSADLSRLVLALEAGFANRRLILAHYPVARAMENLGRTLDSSIELGCGSGAFSLVLKRMGYVRRVTLVDYSRASLAAARALFDRFSETAELVHATLDGLPFAGASFDLALSGGVIEHYRSRPERLACLEAHLDAAPLAFVQAPVSSPFYWFSRLVYTAIKRGWPYGYERPVTMSELNALAGLAGATILRRDHQYFSSFPMFTRFHRLPHPGWYTWPLQNEIAVLARRGPERVA